MKNNKVVANFFWDKKKINLFEYCYLKSFVKNNFKVNLYSFEKIKLPKNVILKDASKILKKNEMKKFIHQGVKGCPAAFADKFRVELMKKTRGWWFDMDMLCLKKASEFKKLEKNEIIIGLETDNYINNAVLKISDFSFLKKISNEINKKGYVIKWGDIGPKLITKLLKEEQIDFRLTKSWFKKYGVTHGTTATDWVSKDLPRKNMEAYFRPSYKEIEHKNISSIFLGYFQILLSRNL